MVQFIFDMVDNIVQKAENTCYQHFLLFSQCFQKIFFPQGCRKKSLCGKGLKVRTAMIRTVSGEIHTYKPREPSKEVLTLSLRTDDNTRSLCGQ